jgi:Domain of Unknown Function (DUF1080)
MLSGHVVAAQAAQRSVPGTTQLQHAKKRVGLMRYFVIVPALKTKKGRISMRKTVRAIAAGLLFGAATFYANAVSAEEGWITLLDPNNKGEWNEVGKANWAMKDGALSADKLDGKDLSYLVTKNAYKDFQIRAEFWVDEEANSGIFIRCEKPDSIGGKTCYEVNIYDKRPDPTYGTGAIVDTAKVDPMPKAAGKWNTYEITAQGPHLVVVLNGQKTADVQDSKHLNAGPFALQYGSGVVKFRKVQIKPL